MTKAQEVSDFPAMFLEIIIKKLSEDMPQVRMILNRVIL